MKKILFLFFALILLLSFVQQQSDLIFWNTKRPLRYEDFKVVQKDTIQIGNTGRFKGAQSSLHYKYNISQSSYTVPPKIEIINYFNPTDSWMLLKDETTLEHEQIHFNIHELFARKMRKSVDSLVKIHICNFNIYDKIFDKWEKQPRKYDEFFDKEIDDKVYLLNGKYLSHKDNKKQKLWKEKIDIQLKALEEYAK